MASASAEKDSAIALLEAGEWAGAWSMPAARATAIVIFDGMHGVVDDAIASGNHDRAEICRALSDLFTRMVRPGHERTTSPV